MSVVTMASPSDCMAYTCSGGSGGGGGGSGGATMRGARGGLLLVDLAAGQRAQLPGRNDFHAGDQQRGRTLEVDLRGS